MIEKLSLNIVLAKLNKFNHIKHSCLSGQRLSTYLRDVTFVVLKRDGSWWWFWLDHYICFQALHAQLASLLNCTIVPCPWIPSSWCHLWCLLKKSLFMILISATKLVQGVTTNLTDVWAHRPVQQSSSIFIGFTLFYLKGKA